MSPKTKKSILCKKDHAHFLPVCKESEQNDSLGEEEENDDEKPKQTTVIQNWGTHIRTAPELEWLLHRKFVRPKPPFPSSLCEEEQCQFSYV